MAKKVSGGKASGKVRVRLVASVIGCPEKQRATVRGLGLRRINQVVELPDTPEVLGMVKKVPHLVALVQGPGAAGKPGPSGRGA